MRRTLVIVGKAPVAGAVKTRLVPPLSSAEAAELYCAFLRDTVDLGLALGWEQVSVVHPRGAAERLRRLLPPGVGLFEQPGAGLADALSGAFAHHFGAGAERVVLIGSDTPTLPAERLGAAWRALEDHAVAIGPSADGGYYLLGLRQPCRGLFEAIDWSTERVYRQTLARAQRLSLSVAALEPWYDVDAPADLDRLRSDLCLAPLETARRTRAVLERMTALAAGA